MNQNVLQPTYFLNYDDPSVQEFALTHAGDLTDDKSRAIKLFEVVRDHFKYDPYNLNLNREAMRASEILKRSSGYCNEKAIVLAACLRFFGIGARLYFGNVKNHIGTEKLEQLLGTDVLAFHGCVEVYLNGEWLKATPAFNTSLCHKLGVGPLQFNGEEDAIFQEFCSDGRRFMEYLKIHGSFDDMPYQLFIQELKTQYAHIFDEKKLQFKVDA